MKVQGLRGPREAIGGIVYFPRMLDKIRLHAEGRLPADYHANLGKGFDAMCCGFLRISYDGLVERVAQGGKDEDILEWCFSRGSKPAEEAVLMFNDFLSKRGWRDARSTRLAELKQQAGWANRDDIQTFFDLIDADEGRM